MKKKLYYLLLFAILSPYLSYSQKNKEKDLRFLRNKEIVVDGDISEWEKELSNNQSEFWSYAVAIDKNYMYAAVVIKNNDLIDETLKNGILLNLSYSNRKKDGAQVYFPKIDAERLRALRQNAAITDINSYRQELLNSVRGYYVTGFSRVINGLLSFDNDYGIQAFAKLDSAKHLHFEAVIPLNLIKFESDRIAVQLAINTQFMQMQKFFKNSNINRNPRGSGILQQSTSNTKNPYSEQTAVWFIDTIK